MTTLRQIFDQLNVPVAGPGESKHVRAGWLGIVRCPHCGSTKTHLGFPENGMVGNCWLCGRHSLWDTLIALGLDRRQASEVLAGLDRGARAPREHPVAGRLQPPGGLGPLAPAHIAYLRRRGLDARQAADLWGAKGIGLASRLAWRIYLPVHLHGREVSWTTRSIARDAKQRYVSAAPDEEILPLKSLLLGEDMARNATIVVEGPMDAIRVGPGAVATFGLNVTAAQVARIAAFPLRAICMDNQERAQRVGERLCRELSVFPGETVRVQLESGEDPGSADPEEIAELRRRFLE